MPWAKIDDQMHRRRKIRGLSDSAWRLYVSAIIDCCAEGSDGEIEGTYLRELLPHHHEDHVRELLARNLLHDAPGCDSPTCLGSQGLPINGTDMYVIHDFGQWQMSRSEWEQLRVRKSYAAHVRWHADEPSDRCEHCKNGCTSDARCIACAHARAMPT
jgi:hypothetical protein